jgi:hypothetical protein
MFVTTILGKNNVRSQVFCHPYTASSRAAYSLFSLSHNEHGVSTIWQKWKSLRSEQAQHQERRVKDSGLRVFQEQSINFTKGCHSSSLLPQGIKAEITIIQKTPSKKHSGVNSQSTHLSNHCSRATQYFSSTKYPSLLLPFQRGQTQKPSSSQEPLRSSAAGAICQPQIHWTVVRSRPFASFCSIFVVTKHQAPSPAFSLN